MKRIIAVFLVLMVSASLLFSQNYQTVYPDRIAYFSDANGKIKCIRIDSIGPAELIPFYNIQTSEEGCITPYGPSWIGEKIRLSDSCNSFFNRRHEMIDIKTDALLNESWPAYHLTDSITIMATVTDTAVSSFLGIQDKVKTIGFQAYGRNLIPKDHPVNDMTIMISENYGFVKTLNFYLFPDLENNDIPYNLGEYDVVGLSDPELGIQNLTWSEVYDFQIGDEMHISYESSSWGCGDDRTINIKAIYRYLSRNDYADSIVYEVELWRGKQTITDDHTNYEYYHDTIKSLILPDSLLEYLPDESIFSGSGAYSLNMTLDTILLKTDPAESGRLLQPMNDSCWIGVIFDGCMPSYTYIKGLGGPYFRCSEFICLGGTFRQLEYYKKGDRTWGTPLVISDVPEIEKSADIEIYPIPAKDMISIKVLKSGLPLKFELIDLKGRTLLQMEINAEITSIRLDDRLNGMYLYKVTDKNGIGSYGNLLVE